MYFWKNHNLLFHLHNLEKQFSGKFRRKSSPWTNPVCSKTTKSVWLWTILSCKSFRTTSPTREVCSEEKQHFLNIKSIIYAPILMVKNVKFFHYRVIILGQHHIIVAHGRHVNYGVDIVETVNPLSSFWPLTADVEYPWFWVKNETQMKPLI